jgi:DNA-directed RNA polymerase specialized sigma24 family protein
MSEFLEWISAQAEEETKRIPVLYADKKRQRGDCGGSSDRPAALKWEELPQHSFAKRAFVAKTEEADQRCDRDPELWLYRKKTTALLRRYMRWSLEAGRVPSLLGRELFRAKISAYSSTTFEARVIFLHDVEGCLERLGSFDRQIIARIVLQEYDHEAAARILQCDRKTLGRRLPELIDELSEAFLRAELLDRLPRTKEEAL